MRLFWQYISSSHAGIHDLNMRIGLNLLFLIPGEVGGTETYTRGLLKALAQTDPHSEYIVYINRESRLLDFIRQPNFQIIECGINASNRAARLFWEQIILPEQVRRARIDVLHSLGYIAPLALPCKSVITIHDLNYKFVPESMTPLTRLVQRIFVNGAARHAAHVITVSDFVRNQVLTYLKVPLQKVTTIHEAVERDAFTPEHPNPLLLERYGIRRPYVFAFSSQTPHKNIPALIYAFERINREAQGKFQLVIGGHQPRGSNRLDELAHNLGLSSEDVILTGYLEDTARNILLSNATVFAFPSLYEGFGLPALEAMSSGTALACSSRASLPEIAGDAAAYFDPSDVKQMAEIILELLRDEDRRHLLIALGNKNLQRFSWEKTARQTFSVYSQVYTG
jgi:glycosyltransferase involved in cell wall biosynthesis